MRSIIIFILFLSSSHAVAQQRWTLTECMDYAIGHNIELMHLLNEQKRREVQAQASKDARLPQFSGEMGGYTGTLRHRGDGNRFDADVSLIDMGLRGALPLYTGNRLSSQIKADRYSHLAALENVRTADKQLKIQVAAAYLQLLYDKGEADIARQRLEVSRLQLTKARSLHNKGKRPESEVAEAMAIVSSDEALLAAAEGSISLARLDLMQLMNLPDTLAFDVSEPDDSVAAPGDAPALADTHPAIRSANYSVLQAEQGVTTARSGYLPTLSLVGEVGTSWISIDADASHNGNIPLFLSLETSEGYSYRLNGDWNWKNKNLINAYVGLKLQLPVFDAFGTKARIRMAKLSLDDARLRLFETQHRVRKEMHQAWQGAVTAYKRYEAEQQSEAANALAYSYALKRYDAGMATLFDLNQSRRQWFIASENVLRLKYEYIIRKKILDIQTEEE